jgi:hypothetical protein
MAGIPNEISGAGHTLPDMMGSFVDISRKE